MSFQAIITVDPYQPIGQIDPNIYGQFLCRRRYVADRGLYYPDHPDADKNGIRRSVEKAIAEAAPTIIRWPGGCTGNSYNWLDGIGPVEQRDRTMDTHFGIDVSNGFGTAEFINFCRRLNAEPQLNLNIGLGTLREGLDWLEYCNHDGNSRYANLRRSHGYEKPFDVRYWQIGNENYHKAEIGSYDADEYAKIAHDWSIVMRKIDPYLKILAVGSMAHYDIEWDLKVLKKAWGLIDYITIHRYWRYHINPEQENFEAIAAVGYLEERNMEAMSGLIQTVANQTGNYKRVPRIAYTEWGSPVRGKVNQNPIDQSNPPNQRKKNQLSQNTQFRLANALAAAGFLNACQRQCKFVGLNNYAQTINVVGMLYVNDEHVVKETVYWPQLMQRHYSGPTAINANVRCDTYSILFGNEHPLGGGRTIEGPLQSLDAVPYLDVSSTMDEEKKKIYVSIVNCHRDEEAVVHMRFADTAIKPEGLVHRLFHEDYNAMNTIKRPNNVVPQKIVISNADSDFEVSLPPHSYSIYELDF